LGRLLHEFTRVDLLRLRLLCCDGLLASCGLSAVEGQGRSRCGVVGVDVDSVVCDGVCVSGLGYVFCGGCGVSCMTVVVSGWILIGISMVVGMSFVTGDGVIVFPLGVIIPVRVLSSIQSIRAPVWLCVSFQAHWQMLHGVVVSLVCGEGVSPQCSQRCSIRC
jgi:hypothetical protein